MLEAGITGGDSLSPEASTAGGAEGAAHLVAVMRLRLEHQLARNPNLHDDATRGAAVFDAMFVWETVVAAPKRRGTAAGAVVPGPVIVTGGPR